MHYSSFLFIVLFLNFITIHSTRSTDCSTLDYTPSECSLTIGLRFLNFNPLLNLSLVTNAFPTSVQYSYTKLNLTYIVEALDPSINESITNYWDTNAPLQEHPNMAFYPYLYEKTPDVFINRTGRQLDARDFEKWLPSVVPRSNSDYTLYILNLTHLDRDGYSHWFSLTVNDPDANTTTTSFFSETTNLYTRPVPGFGGSVGRFYFLDLSAYHWFHEFVLTAWWLNDWRPGAHMDHTIQEMVATYGLTTSNGQTTIRNWIASWAKDIILSNFVGEVSPPYRQSTGSPNTHPTVDIEVLLLSNLTNYGYSLDMLRWLTSEKRIETFLSDIAPFYQWNVNVRLEKLRKYPVLYKKYNSESQKANGHINVAYGFHGFVRNQFSELFPRSTADFAFPTVCLISNDTTMNWRGLNFTGIAVTGAGWQLMTLNPPRVFKINNTNNFYTVPDRGITHIVVHEIGHTLGFGHPHDDYGWGSDYVESVMSYYTGTSNFSTFGKDRFIRTSTDIYLDLYSDSALKVDLLLKLVSQPHKEAEEKFKSVQDYYADSIKAYDSLNYLQAYENISLAVKELYTIKLLLEDISSSKTFGIPQYILALLLGTVIGIYLIAWGNVTRLKEQQN